MPREKKAKKSTTACVHVSSETTTVDDDRRLDLRLLVVYRNSLAPPSEHLSMWLFHRPTPHEVLRVTDIFRSPGQQH